MSLLTKPWAALLLCALPFELFRAGEAEKKWSSRFTIAVVAGALVGLFLALRAFQMGQLGISDFPAESPYRLEFETGVSMSPENDFVIDEQRDRQRLQLSPLDATIRRILYLGDSSFAYVAMATGLSKFDWMAPRPTEFNLKTAIGWIVILLGLAVLASVVIKNRFSSDLRLFVKPFFWLFAGWLPVSGIFYIPHMKYSFTSPHYALLMLPGLTMLFGTLISKDFFKSSFNSRAICCALLVAFACRQVFLYWNLNHVIR